MFTLLAFLCLCLAGTSAEAKCPGVTLVLRKTKCNCPAQGAEKQLEGTPPPQDGGLEEALGKIQSLEELVAKMNQTTMAGQEHLETRIARMTDSMATGQESQSNLKAQFAAQFGELNKTVTALQRSNRKSWGKDERLQSPCTESHTEELTLLSGSNENDTVLATDSPAPHPSTSDGLVIATDSDHPTIYPGLTTEHTVNCTIDMEQTPSSVVSLMSLFISRWNSSLGEYTGLAYINVVNPDQAVTVNDIGAKASGHVEPKSVSFLSLQWDIPGIDAAGLYTCEVTAFNHFGQPEQNAVGLNVRAKAPSPGEVVERMRECKATLLMQDTELETERNLGKTQKKEWDAERNLRTKEFDSLKEQLRSARNRVCDAALEKWETDVDTLNIECPIDLPRSCADINATKPRQVTVLQGGEAVLCDTVTDGGGWVIIQRRTSADVLFYRGWREYKEGFGRIDGNFWLGNDLIHKLTNQTRLHELRVDMMYKGKRYKAIYDSFSLSGEDDMYRLHLGLYQTVASDAGDSLGRHRNQKFSTFNLDNDIHSSNCAKLFHGAWWYFNCHTSNLNGRWGGKNNVGMRWSGVTGTDGAAFVEMKMRDVVN